MGIRDGQRMENPSERNAHPHLGYNGKVVLVHNGIVENYLELKEELITEGVEFKSETDTETIVHLIEKIWMLGIELKESVQRTLTPNSKERMALLSCLN